MDGIFAPLAAQYVGCTGRQLRERGKRPEALAALYAKLGRDTEPDAGRRAARDRWLHAARRQRQIAWGEPRQQQHRKAGGRIYKCAPRSKRARA